MHADRLSDVSDRSEPVEHHRDRVSWELGPGRPTPDSILMDMDIFYLGCPPNGGCSSEMNGIGGLTRRITTSEMPTRSMSVGARTTPTTHLRTTR